MFLTKVKGLNTLLHHLDSTYTEALCPVNLNILHTPCSSTVSTARNVLLC